MKITLYFVAISLLVSLPAASQEKGFQDPLLDHLAGNWIMTGTIAGDQITHDISVEWVLEHYYLRIHEVAREKTETGSPAYEAIVLIGWDKPEGRYVCLWLDSTGGEGLSNGVLGYAKREGDDIPFVFDMGDGSAIHNTFAYVSDSDTWEWRIDMKNEGEFSPFARVVLTRQ